MIRLLGAAAGFAGTVIAGFAVGVAVSRATGHVWPVLAGIFGGLALGVLVVARALRAFVAMQ